MSLYIQLTTRCNMRCSHCGFACTAKGTDMAQDTFSSALKLSEDYGQTMITLGGGEPLLHPLFMDFAWQAIRTKIIASWDMGMSVVGVVTNGKCTEKAKELARMAQLGYISARLSLDPYHEQIEESVMRAFGWHERKRNSYNSYSEPRKSERDERAIGGANGAVISAGRAKGWGHDPLNRNCFCDSVMIVPNGNIWHCSCKKFCYGNINDPNLVLPDYFSDVLSQESCSRHFTKPEPETLVLTNQ